MSEIEWIRLYAKIVEAAAVGLGLCFAAQWTWYSPWWKDPVGRTVMAEGVAILLSIGPSLVESYFHFTYSQRLMLEWVNLSFIALIPVIFAWRILVWHRLPHKGMNLLERRRARRSNRRGD